MSPQKMSPTARTLRIGREQDWLVGDVNRSIKAGKRTISQDLWGFADLAVIEPNTYGVLFLQVTNAANVSNRVKKVMGLPHGKEKANPKVREAVHRVLAAGNRVEVWGWAQDGKRRTLPRVVAIEIDDHDEDELKAVEVQ